MFRRQHTLLALLLGTALGFALAVSDGVVAGRDAPVAPLPSAEARLLAEVIDRIRAEYVDRIDDHELMQHAIRGMVAGLDAHSSFLDDGAVEDLRIATEGNYSGIGIEVSWEDGRVVVVAPIDGSPAARAGLRTGDVIMAIDGHEVATNGLGEAITRMRGEVGTLVRVTLDRPGVDEPLEYAIERARVEVQSVRQALLEPGLGYLRISHFSDTTARDLGAAVDALERASGVPLTGLVLDLRNNPGGVLEAGVDVADAFLDEGLIVSAHGRADDARFSMHAHRGQLAPGARLAVLVNGGSASASEIVAGALKDHRRAVLVGRTTYGKGSVQTVLPLSDGQAIKLTTSRYYTPSGTSIHELGIEPDIPVERGALETATAIDAVWPARDAELAAAVGWLHDGKAARVAVAQPSGN